MTADKRTSEIRKFQPEPTPRPASRWEWVPHWLIERSGRVASSGEWFCYTWSLMSLLYVGWCGLSQTPRGQGQLHLSANVLTLILVAAWLLAGVAHALDKELNSEH